jgi:hypothetical protein
LNLPHSFLPEFPREWEMSAAEQLALVALLQRLRPQVAVEVGTHHGGSLQVLAAYSGFVHSIDIDPEVRTTLSPSFRNVKFHTGSSRELIPSVLAEIGGSGRSLGFVLVDGDHSSRGVQDDLEGLLGYRPQVPLHILVHDSFNPDTRHGIRAVEWQAFPHVHTVDLDFVPGGFHVRARGGAFARSMWGGFARVELLPEPRKGGLTVGLGQEYLHRLTFRASAHRIWHKAFRRLRTCLSGRRIVSSP